MIRSILTGLAICGLSSLALADIAASEEATTMYAVRNSSLTVESDLASRLSLLHKETLFLHILGTSQPYLVGLSLKEFKPKFPTENHIEKNQFLPFRIGNRTDKYTAEILAYDSDFRVGTAYLGSNDDLTRPALIQELCSGIYEKACTIGFDVSTKSFTIALNPTFEVPTEKLLCE